MGIGKRTGASLRLVRALAVAAVMAALPGFLAACASAGTVTSNNPGSGSVITLNNINTLKSLFNRDDGHTRLILIFSPT